MDKINESEVSREHRISPQGTFAICRKHISVTLRGKDQYHSGPWNGGPPFDVELASIPPGKKNYPYHSHASWWEYYIFISGTGKFRDEKNRWHPVQQGDHVQCATNQAHQILNDGKEDLNYYVIANNTEVEIAQYPDSGKLLILPERKLGYLQEADYYEKEE